MGVEIEDEIKSGYINLIRIKSLYFKKIFKILKQDINKKLEEHSDFREEFFDKLYTFFKRYFSEIGSIYFQYTPLHQNIYERVYTDNKDIFLFWKTHMLYYVKTERVFENLHFELEDFRFSFNMDSLDKNKYNKNKQLYFEFKKRGENNDLSFKVINAQPSEAKLTGILKNIKENGINISRQLVLKAFKVFNKQSEIDFFINKNVKEFLKEQFNLWIYEYIFKGESKWTENRISELQILRDFSYKIIDFISQFENELVKIWNKPRFVKNSDYVITLNKIADIDFEIIKKIFNHSNLDQQIKEWRDLGILDEEFDKKEIYLRDLEGLKLNLNYKYLPIDTKYFPDIKYDILNVFDNLHNNLDGWLIKSENYQGLLTILNKFRDKIQTIYIDPPFNTGQDFDYIDKFQDSTWLTFMENRLDLAKDLLNSKGSIFMHLDDNANYLGKFLLNSIFQEGNFRADICTFLGFNKKHEIIPMKFVEQSEIILHYSKSDLFTFNKIVKIKDRYLIGLKGQNKPKFTNQCLELLKSYLIEDSYINYFSDGLFQPFNPNLIVTTAKIKEKGKIKTIFNDLYMPYWENGMFTKRSLFKKLKIDQDWDEIYFFDVIGNVWTDIQSFRHSAINRNENQGFNTQKTEKLLARMILSTSNVNDIVLDFFLGSGTTCAVAQKLKRKWIGIEMGEHYNEVVLPRMKRVLAGRERATKKIKKVGITKMVNWQGGGFFKYYELEQYEDILKKAKYEDTEFFEISQKDPYNNYIFLKDPKLIDALEIDYEKNSVNVDFTKLYDKVDAHESLSNLLGKNLKKIEENLIVFENDETIHLDDLDFKIIKDLIWW